MGSSRNVQPTTCDITTKLLVRFCCASSGEIQGCIWHQTKMAHPSVVLLDIYIYVYIYIYTAVYIYIYMLWFTFLRNQAIKEMQRVCCLNGCDWSTFETLHIVCDFWLENNQLCLHVLNSVQPHPVSRYFLSACNDVHILPCNEYH